MNCIRKSYYVLTQTFSSIVKNQSKNLLYAQILRFFCHLRRILIEIETKKVPKPSGELQNRVGTIFLSQSTTPDCDKFSN